MNCITCGYSMDAFDTQCPRCAQGIVQTCIVKCLSCNHDNSTKRYACVACDARLSTDIATLEKLPLKEYQRKASTLGREGNTRKAIVVLSEAADFYPGDAPTRQVLIGLLERTGDQQQLAKHQCDLMLIQMQGSEAVCLQYGDNAHNSGRVQEAVNIFGHAVQFFPNSSVLHERLSAAYEDNGEKDKADFEARLAARLNSRQQQVAVHQQQAASNRANSAETAGVVAGAAIGTTGAVVGGGITIFSLILGIFIALFGVAICVIGVILCITILGILPGLVMLGVGGSVVMAGFGIMAGGAAAGAASGMLGIFGGALTSGTALLHRSSRKNKTGL